MAIRARLLDYINIFATSTTEHLSHLDTVLRMLAMAGLMLKLRKLFFLQSSVDYVGHVVHPVGNASPVAPRARLNKTLFA